MVLESILNTYGYFALVIGTFLEGETFLIAAGFLAHRGYSGRRQKYEVWFLLSILLFGIVIWITHILKRKTYEGGVNP